MTSYFFRVVHSYSNYSFINSGCNKFSPIAPCRAVSLCPRNFIIVLFLVRTTYFPLVRLFVYFTMLLLHNYNLRPIYRRLYDSPPPCPARYNPRYVMLVSNQLPHRYGIRVIRSLLPLYIQCILCSLHRFPKVSILTTYFHPLLPLHTLGIACLKSTN